MRLRMDFTGAVRLSFILGGGLAYELAGDKGLCWFLVGMMWYLVTEVVLIVTGAYDQVQTEEEIPPKTQVKG
jgi:hypothetical protein